MPLLFRYLLPLVLGLLPWRALAQGMAPDDFRFEHLTVDQGLSHSDALAVAQDRAGFIWVGTNRGLDRYDGYGLKAYTLPVTPQGIAANRIRVLHVAPATGRLWVGTERAGLNYYDAATDQLRPLREEAVPAAYRSLVRQLATASIAALVSDRQGCLWVGTEHHGLFALAFDGHGQVVSLRRVPGAPSPAGEYYLTSLATDAEGNVWVGTYNRGLQVVRPGSQVGAATPLTELVRALHVDRRGDLWIGLDRRVLWVSAANRRAGRELLAHPQPVGYPQVQSLLLDSFGRLWVGTLYGLYVWEAGPATGQAPPLRARPVLLPTNGGPFSLNSERVQQIFEDRTQVMWLCASAGGLNKVDLHQKPFGQLCRQQVGQDALANNYINAIYKEEATNTLWLGTRNGVQAYDLVRHTYRSYFTQDAAMRGIDVATIFRARSGTLWFGTRNHGLISLVRRAGHEKLTIHTQERLATGNPLGKASINRLAEDRYGQLWVATDGDGLLQLSPAGQLLRAYKQGDGGLPSSALTYLLYDPRQDVLWVSTIDAGLLKLRPTPGGWRLLRQFRYVPGTPDGLRVNYVFPLLLDPQGTLWIGTIGGGLHQLTTDAQGHETIHSLRNYLPESDIESILADEAGQLWLGGTGLYRYTPGLRQYAHYDVADGLQSNAFKIGSASRGADGTLYFGGIKGVSYFQPWKIQVNRTPPVVQLTGLRVLNRNVGVGASFNGRVLLRQPLSVPQQVTLRAAENDFSVDFVALSYTNPQKNRYAYRLLGYNEAWIHPGPGQRTASFTSLPPGRYTLEVKADNGEGTWSKKSATMQFDLLAPWWKTGWAYLAYTSMLLAVILLYRRFERARQQLQHRLVLEQFKLEKEKELTNLKLGFFTNVSHELRTPLTLILAPIEEVMGTHGPITGLRDKFLLMHKQTRKLLDLVNQLLDFRKVESGNVPLRASYGDVRSFLTDAYRAFQQQAAERRLLYLLDLPEEPVLLYFDRSKLEIILTNLLANAFKYTPAGHRIELAATSVGTPGGEAVFRNGELLGNYLEISVLDEGVGIAAGELAHIFDPYYQASHTDTLRMTGTGIGLSLVKQYAERHSGTILVESQPGTGTTFRLRLPFGQAHLLPADKVPDADASNAEATLPDLEALPLSNEALILDTLPRLLVVEDNDEVHQYLQQFFMASYEVLLATDGLEGWTLALAQHPDLVISDVMMPRSDGLELCRRLKQHPKTAHIPVLLLTARTAALHEVEGFDLGADDYVSKPFNPLVLQAKAAALLRNRHQLREYYQRQLLMQPTEIVIPDADRVFLEQAMRAVEQHLDDPTYGVQLLADDLHMSQSVLYRRVKSITGQAPLELIRDVRMKRAAQLLAQGQLRVAEVAFQVGIEDARYFRKTFQKIYGVVPSEYARQHRPAATPPAPTD